MALRVVLDAVPAVGWVPVPAVVALRCGCAPVGLAVHRGVAGALDVALGSGGQHAGGRRAIADIVRERWGGCTPASVRIRSDSG